MFLFVILAYAFKSLFVETKNIVYIIEYRTKWCFMYIFWTFIAPFEQNHARVSSRSTWHGYSFRQKWKSFRTQRPYVLFCPKEYPCHVKGDLTCAWFCPNDNINVQNVSLKHHCVQYLDKMIFLRIRFFDLRQTLSSRILSFRKIIN